MLIAEIDGPLGDLTVVPRAGSAAPVGLIEVPQQLVRAAFPGVIGDIPDAGIQGLKAGAGLRIRELQLADRRHRLGRRLDRYLKNLAGHNRGEKNPSCE